MKKILSLVLLISLLVAMLSAPEVTVSAYSVPNSSKNSIFSGKFFYYETPDRSEYQLSEGQLNASTEELVDAILKYPFLVDLFSSSVSTLSAYDALRESFNGIAELESRGDAASIMLKKLVDDTKGVQYDSTAFSCLKTIISMPPYMEELTADEKARFGDISKENEYSANECDLLLTSDDQINSSSVLSQSIAFTENGFSYIRSSNNAYTTSGTSVPLYSSTSDFSSEEQSSIAETTAVAYEISRIANATSKYNCHSYAWYQASASNVYWLADLAPYINDLHCINIAEPCVGAIAVYLDANNQPLHSAIVTSVDGDNIMCESKWGANGLFAHHIANVPSSYSYNNNQVRCAFFNYVRFHTFTVTIDNAATHTKICRVCGWTSTEPHSPNKVTGKCTTCGYDGANILAPMLTNLPIKEDVLTQE